MGKCKAFICAAALVAALGVAGCGGQANASATSESAEDANAAAQSTQTAQSIQSAAESKTAAASAPSEAIASAGSNAASSGVFSDAAQLVAEAAELASAAGSGSDAAATTDATSASAATAADQAASTSADTADANAASSASSESGASSASSESASAESASAESATANPAEPPQDLVIDELGSTTSSRGYVYYGLRITNPNDGYSADLPKLQATGRDEDGNVLFTDTHTLRDVYPGESIYYGFRVGNGVVPSTVDLELSVGSGNWKQSNAERGDLYSFSNLVDSGTQDGVNHFTGEITLNSDVEGAKKPAITVIVRDEDGNAIYGVTAFLQANLVAGVPTSFDIDARDMPEEASTFDVHAMPWSA